MTTTITAACLLAALFLLGALFIIDLKTRLLPNKYVAGFLISGIAFHAATKFNFITPQDMFLGMIAGGGLLYLIRYFANKAYKRDTLGLGDVKLLGAAGVWLGLEHIFLAISLGAFIGIIHGIIYGHHISKKNNERISLSTLSIPAGPGFIIGILIAAIVKFQTLNAIILP